MRRSLRLCGQSGILITPRISWGVRQQISRKLTYWITQGIAAPISASSFALLSKGTKFVFIDFINPAADRSWLCHALGMQPGSFRFIFVVLFYQRLMYWHIEFIWEPEVCMTPGTSPSIPRAQIQLLNDKLISERLSGSENRCWVEMWISVFLLGFNSPSCPHAAAVLLAPMGV